MIPKSRIIDTITHEHFMCVQCEDSTSVVKRLTVWITGLCCWCGRRGGGSYVANVPVDRCKGI